jgi:hypothetical protein
LLLSLLLLLIRRRRFHGRMAQFALALSVLLLLQKLMLQSPMVV